MGNEMLRALMGFERIGKTPYYGLSMTRAVPTLADLLRPKMDD